MMPKLLLSADLNGIYDWLGFKNQNIFHYRWIILFDKQNKYDLKKYHINYFINVGNVYVCSCIFIELNIKKLCSVYWGSLYY